MNNPFKSAPRCVQWAAVLLIALPVYQFVVAAFLAPGALTGWQLWDIIRVLLFPALGLGLVLGSKVARYLLAAFVLYLLGSQLALFLRIGWRLPLDSTSWLVALSVPCLSLGLCFLPAARLYFAGYRADGETEADEMLEVLKERLFSKAGIIVLLLVAVIGIGSFYQARARNASPAHQAAVQQAQDVMIRMNFEQLVRAWNAYSLSNPGSDPKLSDLVGADKFIPQLKPVLGEVYPPDFIEGRDPVAFFPDGSTIRYHLDTGMVSRHARGNKSELTENAQMEENIGRLREAQRIFLRTHPGQTARYKDLVGPGKPLPQFAISVDESYPGFYPPGGDIVATLPNGMILKPSIRPNMFRFTREDPKNPEVDRLAEPIDASTTPFAKLSDDAQRDEIKRYTAAGPATVLAGMLAAKKIEHEPLKVRRLQDSLGGFLSARRVTRAFALGLIRKVEDPTVDPEERDLILGAFQYAVGEPWFTGISSRPCHSAKTPRCGRSSFAC